MKHFYVMLALLMCIAVSAQVTMEKGKLVKDGVSYKKSAYKEVFENPQAADYFQKARTNSTIGQVLSYTGGAVVGYGVAMVIAIKNDDYVAMNPYGGIMTQQPKKFNAWPIVGVGVAMIGGAIPFTLSSAKNVEEALALENGEPVAFQPQFKLESGTQGLAFSYNF